MPMRRSGVSSCASVYGASSPADAHDAPRPGARMSSTVTDAPRRASELGDRRADNTGTDNDNVHAPDLLSFRGPVRVR